MQEHTIDTLRERWMDLSRDEALAEFRRLPTQDAQEFFDELTAKDQAELVTRMETSEQKLWLRVLAPDDAVDLLQQLPEESRQRFLDYIDPITRSEVTALSAYKEDVAGGLMSPRYARVRPEMSAAEAITYLRLQAMEQLETIYYIYVLDAEQHLLGEISLRELFAAPTHSPVRDVMHTDLYTADENMDQEELGRMFAQEDLIAIPVVDAENRMKGIVTIDDIVDVVEEEATEDIQKMGGTEALEEPYLTSTVGVMIRKRAGWLTILFLGEMLTASAMAAYEHEIAKAVILAVFLPMIISSGGNSGSQASTLVIRAMALDEVRLRDWFRVMRRELLSGAALGGILGLIGFVRVVVWEMMFHTYGDHYLLLAIVVGLTLVMVVLWGSLSGALLPFGLRRCGFDPASASTPFVATMVDVTGVIIYFTIASIVLKGTLL